MKIEHIYFLKKRARKSSHYATAFKLALSCMKFGNSTHIKYFIQLVHSCIAIKAIIGKETKNIL